MHHVPFPAPAAPAGVDIDGNKFWTMREPVEETIILNRAEL
ncbi:MAG TPA: hypothetical protein PLZ86_06285 [bacterium]|nr:hypothetical protein [bacterium]